MGLLSMEITLTKVSLPVKLCDFYPVQCFGPRNVYLSETSILVAERKIKLKNSDSVFIQNNCQWKYGR